MIAVSTRLRKIKATTLLFNIVTLLLIYLIPTISHFIIFPLYLIEPMRLMLVLSMVHTNRSNSYLLALTMPLFSFVVSGHPEMLKMVLITSELLAAVWLYHFLTTKTGNLLLAAFTSLFLSKVLYYAAKFLMINIGLLDMQLISTPLFIQAITGVIFSLYLFFFFRRD